MHLKINIFKHPEFEVSVPKMATIRDLQISILKYLRIPVTEHNLRAIWLFFASKECNPSHTLSSLHIPDNSVIICCISNNSLEINTQTNFDEEVDGSNDVAPNTSNNTNDNTNFDKEETDLSSVYFNDSSGVKTSNSPPDRFYQSSRYIFNDDYIDVEDPPSDPSELCYFHSRNDRIESASQSKLPIFNDLILAKEDNNPKGHIKQIKRFEGAQNYSNRIARAKSSFNFKQNSNLYSSSFTSGENIQLKQDEPSCDALPCCFPAVFPSSYSTNGISHISNIKNGNKRKNSSNDANSDKSNTQNTDDNNSNDNSNDNNIILGLDFSIKTEDQKSNF